jgi:hypothetical protein
VQVAANTSLGNLVNCVANVLPGGAAKAEAAMISALGGPTKVSGVGSRTPRHITHCVLHASRCTLRYNDNPDNVNPKLIFSSQVLPRTQQITLQHGLRKGLHLPLTLISAAPLHWLVRDLGE